MLQYFLGLHRNQLLCEASLWFLLILPVSGINMLELLLHYLLEITLIARLDAQSVLPEVLG